MCTMVGIDPDEKLNLNLEAYVCMPERSSLQYPIT